MEGKEQRNGITDLALWATTTTVTSNGSVNSAHESYTGLGGACQDRAWATQRGRLRRRQHRPLPRCCCFVLLAVFIGGLMVGRTPEYPGREDPSAGDQADLARGAFHARGCSWSTSGLAMGRSGRGQEVDLHRQAARFRSPSPTCPRPTTTAQASHGSTGFVQPNAPGNSGSYRGSPSPTCFGGGRPLAGFIPIGLMLAVAGSLASKRGSGRSAPARCGPTRRPS